MSPLPNTRTASAKAAAPGYASTIIALGSAEEGLEVDRRGDGERLTIGDQAENGGGKSSEQQGPWDVLHTSLPSYLRNCNFFVEPECQVEQDRRREAHLRGCCRRG